MKKQLTYLAIIGALCGLYFYAGKLGLSLAVVHPSATVVWPPTGMALAAVLLLGNRVWPAIFLGAFLVNEITAGSIPTSLGIATGNTLEALFGAFLVRRFANGSAAFERSNDVVKFVVLAGMGSTIVSATVGVTTLCLGGFAPWDNYAAIWTTWWLGDMTSDIVVAPLLLVWGAAPFPRWQARSIFDAVCLFVLVFVFGQVVFGEWIFTDIKNYPLSFLSILPLLLSTLRFGQHGAVTSTALMSIIAIWGTLEGVGSFSIETPSASLMLLQAFMATVAVTTLVLASVLAERQQAEDITRQSEERFRSMIENVKDHVIIMLDPGGRVLTWNNGAERLMGYPSEEILGKHYACFFPIEVQESGTPEQLLQAALADGHCEDEGWRLRKDGSNFWANVVIAKVRDKGGTVIGFSKITGDLTRRRRIEEELRLAKEEADAANQAKSAFLANISHEIRTPMTGIIGMAGLMSDTELSPEQTEYCGIIRRSSESLLTVINEVLDFSKVESGKLELEIIDFDLLNVVSEVTDLFAKQAADKSIEIINSIETDVPTDLQGDPGRLRQIISNLVNNALKYTAEGNVIVQVALSAETDTHANLRFAVTDTGIGIPEDKVDKLFNSFTQIDASISRKYGGTGLGLAICKNLVELMGGEIGVDSKPEMGSTFWFALPLLKQPEHDRKTLHALADLAGLRTLIVDGNGTNRAVIEHCLSSLGINSQSAEDGSTALELLRISSATAEPFDLVMVEFMLPGMDGQELAQTIRKNSEFGSPKLLLLTSVQKNGAEKLAKAAGVDACLTVPVTYSDLTECLAGLMAKESRTDTANSLNTATLSPGQNLSHRLRVLVADDNHINQKVIASLLNKLGHRADVVGNGKEALEAFKLVPYDMLLMDVQMPEVDGFETCRQIRALEESKGRHTPIIAITAHARKVDREKCLAAGMDDYVSKPIKPGDLKAALARRMAAAKTIPMMNPALESSTHADILNFATALSQVDGNRELLCEVARLFLDQYPKLLEKTHQALSRSDYQSLAEAAHTLASSVGQLGGQRAYAAAKKLEQVSSDGDQSSAPQALAELEREVQLLRSAVSDPAYFTNRFVDVLH